MCHRRIQVTHPLFGRRRQGHRQNIVIRATPKPEGYVIGGPPPVRYSGDRRRPILVPEHAGATPHRTRPVPRTGVDRGARAHLGAVAEFQEDKAPGRRGGVNVLDL